MYSSRDEMQQAASSAIAASNYRGTVIAGVGSGKTKVSIDTANKFEAKKVLIVAPYTKILENWNAELDKWGANFEVKLICYKSLHKENITDHDLIILDEVHCITPLAATPFNEAAYLPAIIGLTGTPPVEEDKKDFIKEYCPICFVFEMDEAVDSGFVSDYQVILCPIQVDNVNKTIRAGSKLKGYFYITEQEQLNYIDKQIIMFGDKGNWKMRTNKILEKNRFLGSLPSKKPITDLISSFIQNEKHLIFTSTQKMAEELSPYFYHSKSGNEHFNSFDEGLVNKLSVVSAADMGLSINGIQSAIMLNYFSKSWRFFQKIGRILRREDGLPAKLYCVYAKGTREEEYLFSALKEIDQTKIAYL